MMKMIRNSFFLLLFTFSTLMVALPTDAVSQSARSESIAAVVNEEVISMSDVNARMKLIMVSSGLPNTQEIKDRIRPQIINNLIDEAIKIQEADKYGLNILPEEIERGFGGIASQNNMSGDQFRKALSAQGVDPTTLDNQIKSQIAWSKVVQSTMRRNVKIAGNEIQTVMDRMKSKIGTNEYRVFEIFLPVDEVAQEADVRKLANRLHGELRSGKVPFQRVASQFSQSPGASQKGGDIGWVQEGHLSDILDDTIRKLAKGDLSPVVRGISGFHILYLADKRTIEEDTLPSVFQIEENLGNERLNLMQRRHLIDVKTTSFIERRVQ